MLVRAAISCCIDPSRRSWRRGAFVSNALFLVHAFGDNSDSFAEFKHWARILGVDASDGVVVPAGERGGVTLWLGWCSAPVANDQEIRDAV
ncbi:MAG: hypothetical protein IPN16_25300 [Gemmatimonadetes bacterium]|nr:hypothetical protein [Gemmatimonadota bacterium]